MTDGARLFPMPAFIAPQVLTLLGGEDAVVVTHVDELLVVRIGLPRLL